MLKSTIRGGRLPDEFSVFIQNFQNDFAYIPFGTDYAGVIAGFIHFCFQNFVGEIGKNIGVIRRDDRIVVPVAAGGERSSIGFGEDVLGIGESGKGVSYSQIFQEGGDEIDA